MKNLLYATIPNNAVEFTLLRHEFLDKGIQEFFCIF